jgi:hypothetical protein
MLEGDEPEDLEFQARAFEVVGGVASLNELEDRVGGLLENYQANGPVDIGDTEETEDYVEQMPPRIELPQDSADSLLPRSPRRFA